MKVKLCYSFYMNKDLYELSYSAKKDFNKKVFHIVLFVVLIYLSINLILNFVVFPLRQSSVSMEPDIIENSCIFFTPLKGCSRGDVVVLEPFTEEKLSVFSKLNDLFVTFFTAQQFSIFRDKKLMGDQFLIRRVIGMPGDTIYMRDHVLYIKPQGDKHFLTEFELVKKSYNINVLASPAGWDNAIGVTGSFEEIVLGENEYFVLGDNRNSCIDSRLWGVVTKSDIKATALFCYFPFSKMRLF